MKVTASLALATLFIVASCGPLGTKTRQMGPHPPTIDPGATNGSQGTTEVAVEAIDDWAPVVMRLAGVALGLPVLIGAGAAWGRVKPARRFADLVGAVQAGRTSLSDGRAIGIGLGAFDRAVAKASSDGTIAAVKAVKRKRKIKSVSNPAQGE